MKTLTVIIVNYNVKHFLEQCLISVFRASQNIDLEVFVVDNASVDGSVEMVQKKFPQVQIIKNKKNVGFSKANNQAIKISQGKYVLLLNPDTIVQEDTFLKCIDFMEKHPEAGALGIKMIDGSGNFLPESKRSLPTPWVAFYKIFGLSKLFPKNKKFGKYHLTYLDKNQNHEVEVLSGAFMLIRKSVLNEIGLLDEDYFMYGEDVDLSYRIQKAGYKNYYFAESQIIHFKGESTKKGSLNYVLVFYKAMLIFAKKHFSKGNISLFMFLIQTAVYFRAGLAILRRIWNKIGFPLIEFGIIFSNVLFIKNLWEKNYKYVHGGAYPEIFDHLAAPIYAFAFVIFFVLLGAYKRPYRIRPIFIGTFLGFISIATVTYLFPDINFSRAIVGFASLTTPIIALFNRAIHNYFVQGNVFFDRYFNRRTIIVATSDEFERVSQLISEELLYDCDLAGYVTPYERKENDERCLGSIHQLEEILQVHKIEEIIFCNQSVSTREIIATMSKLKNQVNYFRIVPKNANFIMGHHQVYEANPQNYVVFSRLALPENILKKQIFDIVVSVAMFFAFPFTFWIYEKPLLAFKNLWYVLKGRYHLVGYIDGSQPDLPPLKNAILNMKVLCHYNQKNSLMLDKQYARYYSLGLDFQIFLQGFRKIGSVTL
jgi:GT2 family glycosyltransferase